MAHLEQVKETSNSRPQGIKKAFVWEYTIVSITTLSRTNYTIYHYHVFSSCIPHPIIFISFPVCCTSSANPLHKCCHYHWLTTPMDSLQDGCSNSSEASVTIYQMTCQNIPKTWIFISTTVRTTNPRNLISALNYLYQPTTPQVDITDCPSFPKKF